MKARGFYSIAEPFEEKETEKNAAQYKMLESKAKASCFHFGLLLFSTMTMVSVQVPLVASFLKEGNRVFV